MHAQLEENVRLSSSRGTWVRDEAGRAYDNRFGLAGLTCTKAGENPSMGFPPVRPPESGWRRDPIGLADYISASSASSASSAWCVTPMSEATFQAPPTFL